jgi:type III restriction enzyme
MAERNDYADAIGEHLWKTRTFGFKKEEVLVIHTDTNGGITSKDLNDARDAARRIDEAENTYKAIVSVMMLREGWDVRNVTVVLGLRPFTAKAEILPEQVIGRGLRKMIGIGPDIQTLEVLGSKKLLDHLREQLEQEGVGVGSQSEPPKSPVTIYRSMSGKSGTLSSPHQTDLDACFEKLDSLNVNEWGPIYDEKSLAEQVRVDLKMEFATTRTEVHQAELSEDEPWLPQDILASITNKAIEKARLKDTNRFALLYPFVRDYIAGRCFGREIDLEKKKIRTRLSQLELQEGIAEFLGQKFGKITLERRELQFEKADFRLSHTKEFVWRRNLPPLEAGKTVFNYVATYNDFERGFALFLVNAKDVARFASLGTTEQGESGTEFKSGYLKPSGAIGFYHPIGSWSKRPPMARYNWIIETKGREWEGTKEKDEAIGNWCRLITEKSGKSWKYARVKQRDFERLKPSTLEGSVAPF